MDDVLDFKSEDYKEYFDEIETLIRKRVEFFNMSMREFISKIDMTEQGFYKMLKNRSFKIITLLKICDVLNVPPTYFFDGVPSFTNKDIIIKNLKENNESLLENDRRNDKRTNELYDRIKEKDKIIRLLEWKIEALEKK